MGNRKKLLLICGALEAGGAERVISVLSTPFAEAFYQVCIITWRSAPVFYDIDKRVEVIHLTELAKSNNGILKGIKLRQHVTQTRPDIILSFLTKFNMLSLAALWRKRIPIIVAERNDPRFIKGGRITAWLRNQLYRKASGILCQTPSIQGQFPDYLLKKTHIIYNPVNISTHFLGQALNTSKKQRIVTIGRLHPQKNHKLLIDAFAIVHHTHPNYTLTIYGDGAMKQELSTYIKAQGLDGSIILFGAVKNVHQLIADAELFIMTSLYEGMPNALIEAMCMGLPCISTKVSGAVDLIQNGENGILCDPDKNEIAREILHVIDNQEYAASLGAKAVQVYGLLTHHKIAREWIDYLKMKATQ